MLTRFSILLLLTVFFVATSGHGVEFEGKIILEGVLKRAERTIITDPSGENEIRIENSVVLVTESPVTLMHSVVLGEQQIASTKISYPYIQVGLPDEFTPLIEKRVQCSGIFRQSFDDGKELILDVDTAFDCEQPPHQLQTLFYEPEEVELSGLLHEVIYPGPPEYMSVEMGDCPQKVVILTLRKPVNVEVKDGQEVDDLNEAEKGVRELQVVLPDSMSQGYEVGEEIALKGTLYHAHTAYHRRRVLMMVGDH